MAVHINLGVIGAGRIGSLHAQHLALRIPEAEVRAICDPRFDVVQACAAACNIPHVYRDAEPILADPAIDAVVICSSTDTHADLIEQAAAAGKHIFCEKPIDLDLNRIDQALDAVEQAGVHMMVGFNRRFDHNFRRVRDLIAAGAVGQPQLLHIISRDPSPPPIDYVKVSGGIFLDMTIHDFDMARYLTGSEATTIYVMGDVMVDPAIGEAGDIDTAVMMMRFENGVIATIDNSRRAAYGYDQRVEIFGSDGAVQTANDYPNTARLWHAGGIQRDLPLHFFMDRYIDAYVDEMRTFVTCIAEDRVPPVTGEDGRIAILMGLAAQRSYLEQRPVALTEITSLEKAV